MADLKQKDSYDELTPKQQAVVDELVETPGADNTEIAERADVARSTVYNVKEKYGHVVEQEVNKRGRYEGQERTEGNPFAALEDQLGDDDGGVQMLSERPHQPGATDNGDADDEDDAPTLAVTLTREDVEALLLNGTAPDDFRRELTHRVLGLAFDDAGA